MARFSTKNQVIRANRLATGNNSGTELLFGLALRVQMDSVTKAIAFQDTTRDAGHLINCAYYISNREKNKMDSVLIYIDSTNIIRYTEYLDAAVRRTARSINNQPLTVRQFGQ